MAGMPNDIGILRACVREVNARARAHTFYSFNVC